MSIQYISLINVLQKTLSGCPEKCDCEVADEQIIVSVDDIEAVNIQARVKVENFKVSVFCIDQGLTQLPVSLPPDTIYLNLENNQVAHPVKIVKSLQNILGTQFPQIDTPQLITKSQLIHLSISILMK